jgi:hypothetical protein
MRKEKRKMRERREGRDKEEERCKRKKGEETSEEGRPRKKRGTVSGCRPTAGLGLAGLDLVGHRGPRLRRLYFLIFSDGSCSGGFDFFIFSNKPCFGSCFLIFFL